MVVTAGANPDLVPDKQQLDPKQAVKELQAGRNDALFVPSVHAILSWATQQAHTADIGCFFTSGGLGKIDQPLLGKLP